MANALAHAPVLELRGIVKDFPGVRALDGVSIDLAPGEVHAVCGENGAGKSTLIKVLCGCYPPGTFEGEIVLDGRPAPFKSVRGAEELGIVLIAQELALVPELSIEENLVLGREPTRLGLLHRDARRDTARRALARVGLEEEPRRAVGELGVGRQQLVEIAKALAKEARILVLDEPTAALPESDAERLLGLLDELRSRGIAILYVSHRLDELFRIADRITVLRDGRSIGTSRADTVTREEIITRMVGRPIVDLYARPPSAGGDRLLEVRRWTMEDPRRPGRCVLDSVDFDLRAGEVLGIAGLMGSGRTALLASLFGAARGHLTGRLAIGGDPPRGPFGSPAEAIASGVVLVTEDRKHSGLVGSASILENLTLARLAQFARLGGRGPIDEGARRRAADDAARKVRLHAPSLAAAVGGLSGGNQQKVVLGRWLIGRARVLLLDEPTRGVDVGARAEIYRTIGDLSASGIGIVLVSSELPELLGLSHRVLVLNQGRCAARFGAEEATPQAVMAAATRTIAA